MNALGYDGNICLELELNDNVSAKLDWQVEMCIALMKKNGGIVEFSADMWVDCDGCYFTDGDILDYEPNLL